MATLFTKIIQGEIPCHKVAENDRYLAFLDIKPIHPGHTLVIPKQEVNYIFDVDDDLLKGLMVFAKKVAKAIDQSVDCKRVGVMVAGLEVPHCHIHLVPIHAVSDLSFANAKSATPEDLAAMAKQIRSHLS